MRCISPESVVFQRKLRAVEIEIIGALCVHVAWKGLYCYTTVHVHYSKMFCAVVVATDNEETLRRTDTGEHNHEPDDEL